MRGVEKTGSLLASLRPSGYIFCGGGGEMRPPNAPGPLHQVALGILHQDLRHALRVDAAAPAFATLVGELPHRHEAPAAFVHRNLGRVRGNPPNIDSFSSGAHLPHSCLACFFLENLQKPRENGQFLRRTMVEKNRNSRG